MHALSLFRLVSRHDTPWLPSVFFRRLNLHVCSIPSTQISLLSYIPYVFNSDEPNSADVIAKLKTNDSHMFMRKQSDALSFSPKATTIHRSASMASIKARAQHSRSSTSTRETRLRSFWNSMSSDQKKQCAVMTDSPEDADMMYHKGLGFADMGARHYGEAIAMFWDASKMEEGRLLSQCRHQIEIL